MPKKKSKPKDPKKSPLSETTEYQLITLDESHIHQIKHENLIQRIWNTTILIENAEIVVKESNEIENHIKEWQTYLACDKIPNPSKPQKVRNFFDKTDHFEEKDVENTFNWLLAVDECSILNQDIDSVNKTKRFLKKDRINFGEQYDVRISDTMEIARRIQEFLESPNKVVSKRVLQDIGKLKNFSEKKIDHYIDNLTYRVLSSEAAYMESIDVTTSEYSYQGKRFDIHLWTFQNIPIHLDPEETPTKIIQLQQIKTDLKMPFCVLSENMVIRGLHCHFDHFSSLARQNEMPTYDETKLSLKKCLQNEWESEQKIQAEVKTKMMKDRADFEEAMRLKAVEDEVKAKEVQKGDKVKTAASKKKDNTTYTKKLPKEPPIVTPDMIPIVRRDFLEHDSQEYAESRIKFHPHKLRLSDGEINLRQFQILGGVYQINSISKPKAENYPKLILTWYKTNERVAYKNIQTLVESSQLDEISKFFEITFELPEWACNWGEPIPCFFEEGQSEVVAESNEGIQKTLHINSPVIVNDFNLHDLFTKPMMYDFIEHSIPRIISSFKFPQDLHDEEEDKKSKATLARTKITSEDEEKAKELEIQKQLLSFAVQNSPERLFPLFKNVLPVVILPVKEENQQQGKHPYEKFSEFVSALESIKSSYRKLDFKDKLGNTIKILAEDYDGNIRRPRITSKLIAYEQAEGRKSTGRTSLLNRGRASVGSRQSFDPKASLQATDRLLIKSNEQEPAKSSKSKSSQKKQKMFEKSESSPESKDEKDLGESEGEVIEERSLSKWSSKNILKGEFNANEKKVTIWTDRLGTFGFAFNRYQHFPFKSWLLQPFEENPKEFELKIETAFALLKIYITRDGYKVFVTDFATNLKKRKVYLEINEPVKSLKRLKEILQQNFLNIFAEPDAVWYVNGIFSEKHLAAELHTYNCMSLNAPIIQFHSSDWNKQSNRRTMILQLGELKKSEQDFCLIQINPEDVLFVEIKETKNDLGITELEYISTWRNIEWYADLNQLITSNFCNGSETATNDQHIICHLKNLLHAIRPLSFS